MESPIRQSNTLLTRSIKSIQMSIVLMTTLMLIVIIILIVVMRNITLKTKNECTQYLIMIRVIKKIINYNVMFRKLLSRHRICNFIMSTLMTYCSVKTT